MSEATATCFISYSHADKALALAIESGLSADGYRVWIDEGELRIGDSLIEAISTAIGQVDFLIALVSEHSVSSNWCRKEISLAMTGEVNKLGITVLPCRVGDVTMPPALADKLYLTIDGDRPDEAVLSLTKAMVQHLAPVQPLPPRQRPAQPQRSQSVTSGRPTAYTPLDEVRMTGIDTNSMTSPRNDGTPGSALYRVPITLSVVPDRLWAELFVHHWDRPSSFSTMHRSGIASVSGNRIVLDGTTIGEIEKYHLDTLKLAVNAANTDRRAYAEQERAQREQAERERQALEQQARDAAARLKFD